MNKTMKKFDEQDMIKLHDCLKEINIPGKMPENTELEYYINVFRELMDRLDIEEQLAIYIFMTHDTLLSILTNHEDYEIVSQDYEIGYST